MSGCHECNGDCAEPAEPEYCESCLTSKRYVPADIVSLDFERLCGPCAYELQAEVAYVLY